MTDEPKTTPCWYIWSGEYQAWWRRGENGRGEGYTKFMSSAGKWTRAEAAARIRTFGPEKKLELVPDPYGPEALNALGDIVDV